VTGLAVVTGGAGFIGRHVVRALMAQGTAVRVLDLAPRPADLEAGVDHVQGSVLDGARVARALSGAEELYHLAGNPNLWARDPGVFEKANGEGTRIVLDEARRAAIKRVVVTSTEVILRGWRDRRPQPVTEADLPPPLSELAGPYSRSKAIAHAHAMRAISEGLPVSIVYPTVPIGPGDYNLTAPSRMLIAYLEGKVPAYLDSVLNIIAVEDVARGHVLTARKGEPRERFILAGENLKLHQMLALLRSMTGRPMPTRRIPYALAFLAGIVSTALSNHVTGEMPTAPLEGVKLAYAPRQIDGGKAQRLLGLGPEPAAEALRRAVLWLAAQGLVQPLGDRPESAQELGSPP
jgi:dihydroflavonol-4-reductase